MRNGKCPECNSTEVYFASGADREGLRDEHSIYVRIEGLDETLLETYVCANCGSVRAFVIAKDLPKVAAGISKSKPWKKVG